MPVKCVGATIDNMSPENPSTYLFLREPINLRLPHRLLFSDVGETHQLCMIVYKYDKFILTLSVS
jgi:hypothetical protein